MDNWGEAVGLVDMEEGPAQLAVKLTLPMKMGGNGRTGARPTPACRGEASGATHAHSATLHLVGVHVAAWGAEAQVLGGCQPARLLGCCPGWWCLNLPQSVAGCLVRASIMTRSKVKRPAINLGALLRTLQNNLVHTTTHVRIPTDIYLVQYSSSARLDLLLALPGLLCASGASSASHVLVHLVSIAWHGYSTLPRS